MQAIEDENICKVLKMSKIIQKSFPTEAVIEDQSSHGFLDVIDHSSTEKNVQSSEKLVENSKPTKLNREFVWEYVENRWQKTYREGTFLDEMCNGNLQASQKSETESHKSGNRKFRSMFTSKTNPTKVEVDGHVINKTSNKKLKQSTSKKRSQSLVRLISEDDSTHEESYGESFDAADEETSLTNTNGRVSRAQVSAPGTASSTFASSASSSSTLLTFFSRSFSGRRSR